MICSIDSWRYRRGTDFYFHATIEEMYKFFGDIFANKKNQLDIKDFYICCREWIREGDYDADGNCPGKWHTRSFDFNQFIDCYHNRRNIFIGNENITPRNEIIELDEWSWQMSGLIRLHELRELRMTMNTVVYNIETDETCEHTEYHRIYKIFKREFRKRLPYKTYHHGGKCIDKLCRMSEGIVERWKSGIVYSHDPVLD
jgi:hypothetical protein